MSRIYLFAFVGGYTDCKNMLGINNIKNIQKQVCRKNAIKGIN
jgi:hypothetical protein